MSPLIKLPWNFCRDASQGCICFIRSYSEDNIISAALRILLLMQSDKVVSYWRDNWIMHKGWDFWVKDCPYLFLWYLHSLDFMWSPPKWECPLCANFCARCSGIWEGKDMSLTIKWLKFFLRELQVTHVTQLWNPKTSNLELQLLNVVWAPSKVRLL